MFKAMVQHYGSQAQSMTDKPFRTRAAAEKFCAEQWEISKGYNKRTMKLDGVWVVLAADDTYATTYFVQKVRK